MKIRADWRIRSEYIYLPLQQNIFGVMKAYSNDLSNNDVG